MRVKKSVVAIAALSASLLGAAPATSLAAQSAAAFFKGKTITWVVPYSPGGNFDFYSRLIAPYLEKYTGARVEVKNETGAGGVLANNSVYAAAPNGLTIEIINGGGSSANQIAGHAGVRYDVRKFSWLGQVAGKISVAAVRGAVPIKTPEELIHYKKTLKFGATGPGAADYIAGLFDQRYLNPHIKIITGYAGTSEVFAALQRGEIDMTSSVASSVYHHLQAGGGRVVLCTGTERTPFYPKIPALPGIKKLLSADAYANMTAWAHIQAVEFEVAAPPGLAADRLAFLREALRKSLHNPDLLAKAKRAKRPIDYLSGEKVAQLINGVLQSPAEFKEALKAAYKQR